MQLHAPLLICITRSLKGEYPMRLDSWQGSPPPHNKELQINLGRPSKRPTLCGWASVFVLSSVLLLGLARPAQAQTTCSETDTAITGITAVTIDTNTDTTGLVEDCTTLLGLMDELRGMATLNWAVGTAMDMWDGIGVVVAESDAPPRVGALNLREENLTGVLPQELGELTGLQSLALDKNQLTGAIPRQLGNLGNLNQLWLGENDLSGGIPRELGGLTNLIELKLGGNQLTGAIPPQLGNLGNLTYLDLAHNQLDSPIPPQLGNLGNQRPADFGFTFLALNNNNLTGTIPPELGDLNYPPEEPEPDGFKPLNELRLNNNNLSGEIPLKLGKLTNLKYLALADNRLTGPIPEALDGLTSLEELNLARNQLSDPIPAQLGNLTSLTTLRLHRNQLSGPIPAQLGNLTSLTTLWLHRNQLESPLPNLENLTAMEDLDLSHNPLLAEPFPDWLADLTAMQYLYLGFTGLSGPIPTALGSFGNLAHLHLAATNWTGTIPQALLNKQTAGTLSLWTNRRPTVSGDADGEVTAGLPFTHAVPFTDPDDDALICTATLADDDESPLPAWLEIAPETCTLSGPARTVGEEIVVKVTATDEDTLAADAIPCDPDRDEADDEVNPPPLCASTIVTLRVTMRRTDFTNPVLQGATVSGNTVIMTYNEPLLEDGCPDGENLDPFDAGSGPCPDGIQGPQGSQFLLGVGPENPPTPQEDLPSVTVQDNTVRLRFEEGIDTTKGVFLEYKPGIFPIRDKAGNAAAALVWISLPYSRPADRPGAPTNLRATAGDGQVTLRWDAPADDGGAAIDEYEYEINDSGDWISTGGTSTSYTVSGLTNDQAYRFRVRARNRVDPGRASAFSPNVTPMEGAPPPPSPPPPPRPPNGGGPPGGGPPSGGDRGPACAADRHGNTAASATALTFSAATAGAICPAADVDYFTVTAPDRGLLFVETTGSVNLSGTLWQGGDALAAGPTASQPAARLGARVEAGAVVVAVAGQGGATGDYALVVTFVPGFLENPGTDSFQSGIGLISGWVCEAEAVEIEIETAAGEVTRQEAAYGTARGDTAQRPDGTLLCGDTDNGFGLLFNWNLLGDGEHEVVAVVDGVELGRATVTVTTLGTGAGAEFLRDVAGSCTVEDFPMAEETVRLEWQEPNQNFVMTGGMRPAGENRAGIAGVGNLENPGPNSFQSGIGLISGWVCEAERVEIEMETAGGAVHRFEAAYGTERADTRCSGRTGRCCVATPTTALGCCSTGTCWAPGNIRSWRWWMARSWAGRWCG